MGQQAYSVSQLNRADNGMFTKSIHLSTEPTIRLLKAIDKIQNAQKKGLFIHVGTDTGGIVLEWLPFIFESLP